MRKEIVIVFALLLAGSFVFANENFEEAENLISSKISCAELTSEQFEVLGDYYMEQMHPGQSHELMDNMMGGEGSETLKQMHTSIAQRIYCNNQSVMMQGNMMGYGMMSGMIGMRNIIQLKGGKMAYNYGMMSGYGYGMSSFGWITQILIVIALVLAIFWLIKQIQKK